MELPFRRAVQVALLALVLGTALAFPAQLGVVSFSPYLSALVIAVVVLIGVFADIVGVSATRAHEKPFMARASKRIPGAREGLYLVRHADAVATVLLDLVGDLAGTVSGALAAGLVLRLVHPHALALATAIAVGVLSAFTVGLKALAKAYAVRRADAVVSVAGRVLHSLGVLPFRPKG